MVGIPGLDRVAMERERLARLAVNNGNSNVNSLKRQRSISPPPVIRPSKATKVNNDKTGQKSPEPTEIIDLVDSPSPVRSKKSRVVSPPTGTNTVLPQASSHTNGSTSSSQPLLYPHGVIRKTWAYGHNRQPTDIKIEEVLEKATLRTALLSAFQWDVPWIMSKLDLSRTKLIFVMQAKDQATKEQWLQETEYMRKILRLCFPSMEGNVNCMHSKLMLLFHPHKLRVVVPSANLVRYDWGETGVMENSVFLIDLPRLPTPQTETNALTPFGQELLYFLEKMGTDEDLRKGVLNFDFSTTKDIAFIHSVGGAHYGHDLQRTGFCGLSKAVRDLNLTTDANLQIDLAASSIGSLTDDFLRTIHSAARGEDATTAPMTRARTAPKPFQTTTMPENVRDVFRIYFPTHDTVAASTGGTDNGGTICLQRKWWEGNNTFPRLCFRDYKSIRKGMLSHNKIIYARGAGRNGKKKAWVYMGSANLSESAWGKVTWDRSRKEWKIGCRNWECGVLLPVMRDNRDDKPALEDAETESEDEDAGRSKMVKESKGKEKVISLEDSETESEDGGKHAGITQREGVPGMEVFKGILDVPFEYPGVEYGDKQPWYFME